MQVQQKRMIGGEVYKLARKGRAPSRIPSAVTRSDGFKIETVRETAEYFLKELIQRDDEYLRSHKVRPSLYLLLYARSLKHSRCVARTPHG